MLVERSAFDAVVSEITARMDRMKGGDPTLMEVSEVSSQRSAIPCQSLSPEYFSLSAHMASRSCTNNIYVHWSDLSACFVLTILRLYCFVLSIVFRLSYILRTNSIAFLSAPLQCFYFLATSSIGVTSSFYV